MADFNIQRGEATIASSGSSITITAGSEYTAPSATSKAFIRITGNGYAGDGINKTYPGNSSHTRVWITNPSNLLTSITFSRQGTPVNAEKIQWEIIEYVGSAGGAYEIKVLHEELMSFGASDVTKDTSTVSGVATDADVLPFITSQGCTSGASADVELEEFAFTSEWIGASDVARMVRGDTITRTSVVSLGVVEFTGSNWRVERVTHTYTTAATEETETLGTTLGATTQAFIHPQIRIDSGSAVGVRRGNHKVWISSTSQLTFYAKLINTTPPFSVAWVVEDTSGGMVVEHLSGTRAATGILDDGPETWAETVNSVTLTTASVMGECAVPNNGNRSNQALMGVRLTAATTATLSRGSTYYTREYRFSVVQWPTATSSVPIFTNHLMQLNNN